MATLLELRSQLDSARDLRGVVTTMKSMAAVNLRQFQRAADALEEYRRTVERGLQIALREHPSEDPREPTPEKAAVALVVLGSDQGMVGPFNERLADHVASWLGSREIPADDGPPLLAMGGQIAGALEARDLGPRAILEVPATPDGIVGTAESIVISLEEWRTSDSVSEAWVLHNAPTSAASYEPRQLQVLPLDPEWLGDLRAREWPTRVLPAVLRDPRELLPILVQHHMFAILYRLIAGSVAAENAARLAAMESAERNIRERIEALDARYRRQRQEEITGELLDVVAGYEALQ